MGDIIDLEKKLKERRVRRAWAKVRTTAEATDKAELALDTITTAAGVVGAATATSTVGQVTGGAVAGVGLFGMIKGIRQGWRDAKMAVGPDWDR